MRGSIRRKAKGWEVTVDLAPDPVTGRRRRKSRYVQGSRDDAEAIRRELVGDVQQGLTITDRRMTVSGFIQLWLEARRAFLRPRTVAGYREKLTYLDRHIGHRRLAVITPAVLSALYGRLLERGLSASTVHHLHAVTRRMFSDAERWGYLRTSPARNAEAPRMVKPDLATWTAQNVHRFLEGTVEDRWFGLWRLAAGTGMRRGELVGLTWDRIDLAAGEIRVEASVVVVDGRPTWSPPKSRSSLRVISLDPTTVEVLRKWRMRQAEQRLALGYRDKDLVFCWPDGRLINPNLVSKWFRQHVVTLGLPPIRFHDLRHTWATLALAAGVPAKVVSLHLGHSGIAITLDTYTHRVQHLQQDAATAVASLIDEGHP